MAFPKNEAQTIALFGLLELKIGWRIAHLQTAFPDAIIEHRVTGARLVAEFEFTDKNFAKHGHPVGGCDLIICWERRWENPPLPVWALKTCAKKEAAIIEEILRPYVPRRSVLGLYNDIREYSGQEPAQDLSHLSNEYQWWYEWTMAEMPIGWEWAMTMGAAGLVIARRRGREEGIR